MGEIVSLRAPEMRIWVCQCGCSTFELLESGDVRCASCSHVSEGHGGWYAPPPDAAEFSGTPTAHVGGNGEVEFARKRVERIASQDDVAALIVLRRCGAVHAWSEVETPEQVSWLRRKLAIAIGMIRRNEK